MAKSLGQTVKSLREKRKISQKDLAREAGISVTFLSLVENDREQPSEVVLNRVAGALNVTIDVVRALSLDLSNIPELSANDRKVLDEAHKELKSLINDVYNLDFL